MHWWQRVRNQRAGRRWHDAAWAVSFAVLMTFIAVRTPDDAWLRALCLVAACLNLADAATWAIRYWRTRAGTP